MKHLVIGDSHSKPGVSNDRYEWLGRLVCDVRPDVIINIGDWADMESLCYYDKGKKSYEGRRYLADIEAANDALRRFHKPIKELNHRLARLRTKQYQPRLVALMGNHEYRINKVGQLQSELDGLVSTDDIQFAAHGWETHGFLYPVEINGILYCHYFQSGVMGKAIGGDNIANRLIQLNFQSSTVGHGHYMHYRLKTRRDGRRLHALEAGCYFEHDEPYAGMSNRDWWRGIVIKNEVRDGEYDLQLMSLDSIKRRYA